MRSLFSLSLIVVLACVASFRLSAQECPAMLEFFPGAKIFPLLPADGLAHGMSISRVTDNREWIGAIGGALPLARVTTPETQYEIGAAVTTYNRIIKTPGHITVYTIDYKVDFPLDVTHGAWSFRISPGHVSSHFVDDGIEILGAHSVSYVRDYVTLMALYRVSPVAGFVYAGADFNYHFEPVRDKKWFLQWGWEGGNLPLGNLVTLYGAIDVKFRQNLGWGSTQSYQIGARFLSRANYGFRLAYTHRRGLEERGQLFRQTTVANLIGLFIDF